MIKKLCHGFLHFVGSSFFFGLLLALFAGITAISPDLFTNPVVFFNYIGYLVLNYLASDMDNFNRDMHLRRLERRVEQLEAKVKK